MMLELEEVFLKILIYSKNMKFFIENRRISFHKSKHESEEDTYQRAISFLEILQHRQTAGNS